jgi:hypothetical protein
MRFDYTHGRRATPQIANQRSKQRQAHSERCCPIDRIEQPEMFNVARFLSAALLAQDSVIWVALSDALSE